MGEIFNELQDVQVERTNNASAQEVVELRVASGSNPEAPYESVDVWRQCLERSLCVVEARDTSEGRLIGMGRISGDPRQAQIVDMIVHPEHRELGIGGAILDELVCYLREENIPYSGLTFDPKKPWLEEFYAGHGFQKIGFGMWLNDSVDRVRSQE